MVSEATNVSTVRGGAPPAQPVQQPLNTNINGNGKSTVGRSQGAPPSSRWDSDPDPDEEDTDVFADANGGPAEGQYEQELDPETGEELDDRTMLDSVILPIISSVSFFGGYLPRSRNR